MLMLITVHHQPFIAFNSIKLRFLFSFCFIFFLVFILILILIDADKSFFIVEIDTSAE